MNCSKKHDVKFSTTLVFHVKKLRRAYVNSWLPYELGTWSVNVVPLPNSEVNEIEAETGSFRVHLHDVLSTEELREDILLLMTWDAITGVLHVYGHRVIRGTHHDSDFSFDRRVLYGIGDEIFHDFSENDRIRGQVNFIRANDRQRQLLYAARFRKILPQHLEERSQGERRCRDGLQPCFHA